MENKYFLIIIGIAAIGYGIYSIFIRMKSPEKFGKLEPMKKLYGEKLGLVIHFISYTVVPIVIGVVMLVKVFLGV